MRELADRAKFVVRFDAQAFILGLGYVMGLRSSMILCAGGIARARDGVVRCLQG